jgi:hypothetical protein
MKKLMFTFAILAVAFTSAQAQKQLGGEHNIEVSFNPLGDNPINASVMKYRKFLDDDRALRVTLGINNTSNSYLVAPENSLTGGPTAGLLTHPDLFLHNNFSQIDLGLGYEMHFKGTDNLSPYVGFAAGISMETTTLKRERFSALNLEDATATFWEGETDPANWGVWSYQNDVTSSTLNLDLLFGADYYFNDAIYVGFEAGLRYGRTSGITSTISASDANAFNIYFDTENVAAGFQNDESNSSLVVNTNEGGGSQWNSATPVDFVINSQPWLGEGVETNYFDPLTGEVLGPQEFIAYEAADALWNDWSEQSPATQDSNYDAPRDAFFSGSNFLGTYSTGMLRIGFLFE